MSSKEKIRKWLNVDYINKAVDDMDEDVLQLFMKQEITNLSITVINNCIRRLSQLIEADRQQIVSLESKLNSFSAYMEQLNEKYMRLLTTVEKHVVQEHKCKCKKGKK